MIQKFKIMKSGTRYWQKIANELARDFAPDIYPCRKCNYPVISGYCCRNCKCGDPYGEEGDDK